MMTKLILQSIHFTYVLVVLLSLLYVVNEYHLCVEIPSYKNKTTFTKYKQITQIFSQTHFPKCHFGRCIIHPNQKRFCVGPVDCCLEQQSFDPTCHFSFKKKTNLNFSALDSQSKGYIYLAPEASLPTIF